VIDAGRRILKSNDRFLVPGLPRGLAGMPALWDPLSACRIVLICLCAQIVYSSSERPSGRRILTMSQQPVFRFEAEGSMYVDKCWCRASVKCQLQRLYSQVVAEKSAGKVENRRLNLSVKNVEIVGRMSVIQENVRTCDLLCAKALLSGFHTFKTACAGSLWLLRCCSSKLAIPRNAV
jgi:hypothetical protein